MKNFCLKNKHNQGYGGCIFFVFIIIFLWILYVIFSCLWQDLDITGERKKKQEIEQLNYRQGLYNSWKNLHPDKQISYDQFLYLWHADLLPKD